MKLTVATYNINSIRVRLPLLLRWLEAVHPDVVCLQETKVQDNDFPALELRKAGYDMAFCGQKSYNGVAILSRHLVRGARFGFDSEPKDRSRLITATVCGIGIVNSYVPQGRSPDHEMYTYKLAWLGRLRKHLEARFSPDEPLIWLGDFNIAPEPIDVYDPKRLSGHVCFNPQVTEALNEVKTWGLVDVFRKHVPDEGQYSFYDYRAKDSVERGTGWRVDHILATGTLAEKSSRAWIDVDLRTQEKPSDHVPVLATFEV